MRCNPSHRIVAILLALSSSLIPRCSNPPDPEPAAERQAVTPCDGRQALLQAAAYYRQLDTLDESWTARIEVPGAPAKEEVLEYGFRGERLYLRMPGLLRIERPDARLLLANDSVVRGASLVVENGGGSLQQRIDRAFGSQGPPTVPPALLLREAAAPDVLDSFRLKLLAPLKVDRCRDDVAGLREVDLAASNGRVKVSVEPSGRISSMGAEIDAGGGSLIRARIVLAAAPPPPDPFPVTKIASSARIVSGVAELFSQVPPPPFAEGSFLRGDGRRVRVTDLRGSIVVLEFFATWCAPCRLALPAVDRFEEWARREGVAVKVFAVNTEEGAGSLEETAARASRFLQGASVDVPVLYDLDGAVHRSVGGGLPLTVIIDAHGRIVEKHGGFDARLDTVLQERVKALATARP